MPMAPYIDEIIKNVAVSPILGISAPTGSGKTRLIPWVLAAYGLKVRVSIPTTVAVINSYSFQKEYSGLSVGYAAGRKIEYKAEDILVYGTTGHFVNKILSFYREGKLSGSDILGDILMIDEVHIGSSQTTLLLGLLRYLYDDHTRPGIIFSSATLDDSEIASYFGNIPRIDVLSESPFKITDEYLKGIYASHNPMKNPPEPLIENIIRKRLAGRLPGNGIIFRPGYMEVESTVSHLSGLFPSITFLPAYSSLSDEEINKIFTTLEMGKGITVIVGTNIVESSITLKNIAFVIDDMLEKIIETTATGGTRLALSLVSQSASQQRRGRTGRTQDGIIYRLISQEAYHKLPLFRPKEVDRIPIYDIMISLIDVGLDPQSILIIDRSRYLSGIARLKEYGMLTTDGQVTEGGKFASLLPLSIETSFMIYLGYKEYIKQLNTPKNNETRSRLLFRSVIAVSVMISVHSPPFFYLPRPESLPPTEDTNTFRERYHSRFKGDNDIHTFINIYWNLVDETSSPNTMPIKNWCVANGMNNKKINEALSALDSVISIIEEMLQGDPSLKVEKYYELSQPEIMTGNRRFAANYVSSIFSKAFYFNQLIKIPTRKGKISFKNRITGAVYQINFRGGSYSNLDFSSINSIVVGETLEILGNQGTMNLAGIIVGEK